MRNRQNTFLTALFILIGCQVSLIHAVNPLEVKTYTLSNGLTVWLNEDHSQPKIYGAVLVKAGAKECPNTGIAHYFEHMMFKGTDKIGTTDYLSEKVLLDSVVLKYDELATIKDDACRKNIQKEINTLSVKAAKFAIPNEFDKLITRYGGSGLNAGTSQDYTVYHNQFSPQYINQWAEVNSERLINPVFRLFQSELETVYEEKNMYSDQLGRLALEKASERFFQPNPYKYSIIGSTENLKNPQISQMRTFFENYYVAGNMGLILCGDFKSEEILPVLERTFSRIKAGEAPQTDILQPRPFVGRERFEVKLSIPLIKAVALGWRGVPSNHEDEMALNIMFGLLTNSNGTGYLDKLGMDKKVFMAAGGQGNMNDAGLLFVMAIPKIPFQSCSKAKACLMKEVERIKNGDFSEESFNSLKLEQKRTYEKQLEDINSRTNQMIDVFSQGISWETYLGKNKKIDALTKNDIVNVANKYFTENYLEVTKKTGTYPKDKLTKPGFAPIIPKNMEAKSEYAKNLEKMETQKLAPHFLDFNKDVKCIMLAPLVTLYTKSNPVNDIFTFDLKFGKGTLESPILDAVSTHLSMLGTDSLTFDRFRGHLQKLGSTLNFDAESEMFVLHVSGFDFNFDETLSLVCDFIKHASPDETKISQLVDEAKISIKSEKKSADEVSEAILEKIQFGEKSTFLNRLSLSEIKKLKSKVMLDEFNAVTKVECEMHYCGNISSDSVAAKIKRAMAPQNNTIASQGIIYRELKEVEAPVIYFCNMPKASQSVISCYISGDVDADFKGRSASSLFNNYFGGNMGSILFQQIREFRSLAYRASGTYQLQSYRHKDKKGKFIASLSTQCDKTTDAIFVLDSLIRNMPENPERVEMARQEVVNTALNAYPSYRQLSPRIADLKRQGFKSDPSQQLIDAVNEMYLQDILNFYQKNLKGKSIAYVVVGDRKKIDMKMLSAFGKIIEVKTKEIFR